MRIYSWNVNGLRSVIRKSALQEFIDAEHPDILCLQETKAKPGQAVVDLPDYLEIWHSAERPGYSGTAVFTKFQPLSTSENFNTFPDINNSFTTEDRYGNPLIEGRIQTLEFQPFFSSTSIPQIANATSPASNCAKTFGIQPFYNTSANSKLSNLS